MSRRYKQLEDNRLEHRVIMEDALGFKLLKLMLFCIIRNICLLKNA